MPKSNHYSKAPIAEAVISLQVESSSPLDAAAFNDLADKLPGYPKRALITGIEMGVSDANTASPLFHNRHSQVGLRLESADSSRVLQLQRQSFTFSHMPPYSSWKQFKGEGVGLWKQYVVATGPGRITRAAVRVINRLNVPAPMRELPRYVKLLPALPDSMPSLPDTFFMQFQLSLNHLAEGCRAIVNVGSGVQDGTENISLLLDFDVFVQHELSVSDDVVWPLLDKLSEGKNELFEACITDATRELIR